jgi:hypothetical protein
MHVKMTNPQGYLTADLVSQAREQDEERSILIVSSFLSQPAAPVAFLSQSATFHHHLLLRFLQFHASADAYMKTSLSTLPFLHNLNQLPHFYGIQQHCA